MAQGTQQPPNDKDAEQAVLGSILIEPQRYAKAAEVLADGAVEFFFERHGLLYEVCGSILADGAAVDSLVIKDRLVKVGHFERLGGYEFLAELVGKVPSATRVAEYAKIVHDHYCRRRAISACHQSLARLYDPSVGAGEAVDRAEADIREAARSRAPLMNESMGDVLAYAFRNMQDPESAQGKRSGYASLDDITGGFRAGEMIVLAARPAVGKTSLALCIADRMIQGGDGVVFFSIEMTRHQLAERLLCSRAQVDAHRIRRGMVELDDLRLLEQALATLSSAPFYVEDRPQMHIELLCAIARNYYYERRVELCVVDYLQLVRVRRRMDRREREVATVSADLKDLARELELPVLVLSQLSREGERRQDTAPRLSDLRESGTIEQDADLVILLDPRKDENEQAVNVHVAKNRNGPTGRTHLYFDKATTTFSEYAQTTVYDPTR